MIKGKGKLRALDAPVYRYWQAVYLSFYSYRLYVDVFKRWRGYGILYLLFLLTLTTIPLALRMIVEFNTFFNEQVLFPLQELPPLYVQDGKISLDKPTPYFIKNKGGEVVAIVDTTGSITSIKNKQYPHLTMLITSNQIHFRPPVPQLFFSQQIPGTLKEDSVYTQTLTNNTNEIFVAKKWVQASGILNMKLLADALIYPMLLGFFISLYLVLMLILGFLGQVFASTLFGLKLRFKDSTRLFAVSVTPQVIFSTLLLIAKISFAASGLVNMILVAVYYSYAVASVKREHTKMVLS
ncbi:MULTISPECIES: DUF1189 family protein [Legionella]|uniref:DUF1189 family protein n=1 Tax=Legionella TaxID=445 RepID=UPI000F8E68B0|nr:MULTISPECIES: DUF1189 family protein [Legionella]MCP0913463.1 DUF1189 domain-containing protein [Legionella sp. 27cVA30]RUQ99547.1 DUF1189 domain-containing protein [Legionella septentrionalis]RUR11109.1 DUF1189 domain-containing protein [Legionella septentrionalis]RUR14426.1 DUF1189 domain-containing protein [Legionella septentrionalis]